MSESISERPTGWMSVLLARTRPFKYVIVLAFFFFGGLGTFWLLQPVTPGTELQRLGFLVEETRPKTNSLIGNIVTKLSYPSSWTISSEGSNLTTEQSLDTAVQQLNRLEGKIFFWVAEFDKIENLEALKKADCKIESLVIKDCAKLQSLAGVTSKLMVGSLMCNSCPELTDLSDIENRASIYQFGLTNCPQVTDFTFLEKLPALHYVHLDLTGQQFDIPEFKKLSKLHTLTLENFTQFTDIKEIKQFEKLKTLVLSNHSLTEKQLQEIKQALPNTNVISQ